MNELLTVRNFVNDKTIGLGHAEHRQLVVVCETKKQTIAFREIGPATRPWCITAASEKKLVLDVQQTIAAMVALLSQRLVIVVG
jgi:hypothetical protein